MQAEPLSYKEGSARNEIHEIIFLLSEVFLKLK
jgi:hypothetical protein